MTGTSPKVKSLFGVPVAAYQGTIFIDVDMDTYGVAGRDDKEGTKSAYMLESGVVNSALEGIVIEQVIGMPAVSTMRILSEAKTRGIDIVTLSESNAEKLEDLDIKEGTKSDIKNCSYTTW